MTIWENSTSVSLKKTPTSWAQHDTLQETIAFANKRKSLLVIQLKNKLSDLKPLFSHKKSLTLQKRSKKMFLHWTANLADQNKHQPLKIDIRVTYHTVLSVWNTPLIDTCQHCSTSRTNQAPNAGFQNRGVCLQAFPSFPSPSPHFHFFALVSFLARPKPRIPFLCLSLLRNQTETLATQTIWSLKTRCKHKFVWESKYSPFVQLKLLNFDPFCVEWQKPIQFSIATAYGILVAILSLFSVIMSIRLLYKQTSKRPSNALFYFPQEQKTGIAPTWIINEKELD